MKITSFFFFLNEKLILQFGALFDRIVVLDRIPLKFLYLQIFNKNVNLKKHFFSP